MKRRVGAILVRNNRVVATGYVTVSIHSHTTSPLICKSGGVVECDRYNGTARGLRNCNQGGCSRCNSGGSSTDPLDECICLHAEENALLGLLEAGRERPGEDTVLYCNTCPCLGCSVRIIQSGVKEVVYHLSYKVCVRSFAFVEFLHSCILREQGRSVRRFVQGSRGNDPPSRSPGSIVTT